MVQVRVHVLFKRYDEPWLPKSSSWFIGYGSWRDIHVNLDSFGHIMHTMLHSNWPNCLDQIKKIKKSRPSLKIDN